MIKQFYKQISNPALVIVLVPSITILTTGTLFYWIKPPSLPPPLLPKKHTFYTDDDREL